MHVHQLPMQPDRIPQQPAREPTDAGRLRAVFEQTMALAVKERSPNDRRQPQGEKPQQVKAGRNQTAAASAPAARRPARPTHDGEVDVLV